MAVSSNTRKGIYNLINPDKCLNYTKYGKCPVFRSRWEAVLFRALDLNENVKKWGSELPEISVEYISPVDKQKHRYFPDLYVEVINRENLLVKWVVEVKPLKECSAPVAPNRKTKKAMANYVSAQATWLVNQAKWMSAKYHFDKLGYKFIIATEDTIFKKIS